MYRAVDPDLVSPQIRSHIEKYCRKIAVNELESVKVVNHILRSFKSKYEYLEKNFSDFENAFRIEVLEKQEEYNKAKKDAKESKKTKDEVKVKEASEPQQEDLKSYEHCTVYEEHKERLKKKLPDLQCRMCDNGIIKQTPDRIAMNNTITLRCGKCK